MFFTVIVLLLSARQRRGARCRALDDDGAVVSRAEAIFRSNFIPTAFMPHNTSALALLSLSLSSSSSPSSSSLSFSFHRGIHLCVLCVTHSILAAVPSSLMIFEITSFAQLCAICVCVQIVIRIRPVRREELNGTPCVVIYGYVLVNFF